MGLSLVRVDITPEYLAKLSSMFDAGRCDLEYYLCRGPNGNLFISCISSIKSDWSLLPKTLNDKCIYCTDPCREMML